MRVSRRQVFYALKVHKKRALELAEERADAREYGYDDKRRCPVCNSLTLRHTGDRMKCDNCGDTLRARTVYY